MAELSETSEKKMQQITCENDNCAHYISKRYVHFYKNKFLYIISAASLIFIILFGLLTYSYNKSQETIVNNYKEEFLHSACSSICRKSCIQSSHHGHYCLLSDHKDS